MLEPNQTIETSELGLPSFDSVSDGSLCILVNAAGAPIYQVDSSGPVWRQVEGLNLTITTEEF